MPACIKESPVAGPKLRESGTGCGQEMDRVAGAEEDLRRKARHL
jgi:hypothetical protein